MCLGIENCQDIYYTRENLAPSLQTRDIPGQHVTFELQRFPDGKLTAKSIRPIGEDPYVPPAHPLPVPHGGKGGKGKVAIPNSNAIPGTMSSFHGGMSKGSGMDASKSLPVNRGGHRGDEEDRSRDWN